MATPRIKQTILATLAPLLVAPVTSCCGSEPPSYVGFDVAEWSLTPEMYGDLLAYWEPIGHSPYDEWKFLTQREQCLVACAYFGGLTLVDVGIQGGRDVDYHSAEVDACGFGIPTDEAGGWVSCQGVHKITPGCTTGRRPLRSSPALDLRPRHHQRLLDDLAREEQVSVTAFEELAAQLVHHGAPPSLVRRCREAAQDERRHAEQLIALGARRPNAEPEASGPTTSLADIALHNAVEGCVSETWSALEMHWRAVHAAEARARATFAQIADDEARHAQLAWDLHPWLCSQLDAERVRDIEVARARAQAALPITVGLAARSITADARAAQGLPDPDLAVALARAYAARLAA